MKKVIGLTGMSGSGKSTVAAEFVKKGAAVIDCDGIAHQALKDANVRDKLTSLFGADIIKDDGSVDRRLLASRAFSDSASTALLNSATHPYILGRVKEAVATAEEGSVTVIDAPLLFDCGLETLCDATVAVVADIETLARRIALRDGLGAEEVEKRLSAQKDMPKLLKRADYIIENRQDMTLEQLKCTAANIYACIINNDKNDTERKM